jgi:hypothetical protein
MYKAPRDKLICILNCCKVIGNLLLNASLASKDNPPGADEFLPVLIYVTLKVQTQWFITYIYICTWIELSWFLKLVLFLPALSETLWVWLMIRMWSATPIISFVLLCHFALFFTIWTPLLQIKLAILWSYWKLLVTCLQENIWRLLWNIVLHTLVHSSQNDQITHKICITLFFVMFVALLFALKNYLLNCSWCELWSFMIFSFDFFKGKFFTIQIEVALMTFYNCPEGIWTRHLEVTRLSS